MSFWEFLLKTLAIGAVLCSIVFGLAAPFDSVGTRETRASASSSMAG